MSEISLMNAICNGCSEFELQFYTFEFYRL